MSVVLLLNHWFGATAQAQILRTVALSGQQAPGTAPGVVFGSNPIGPVALNNHGQVAFTTSLDGPGVTGATQFGLWSEGEGNGLQLIARSGTTTSGVSDGTTYSSFSLPLLSDSGVTAFRADFLPKPVGFQSSNGIWSHHPQTGTSLVARVGDPAPETGTSYLFLERPVINEMGQIAFGGSVNLPANESAIWQADHTSAPQLVADTISSNIIELGTRNVRINDGGTLSFSGGRLISPGTFEASLWQATPGNGT